ncbi:hypothetical protein [Streptomyces erythrochromogenes]|uniref:hypothetical protein n=1 Tax=Streptomyces erythrochromogenes TaxID=285574 RepID=UPI0036B9F332
MLGLLLAVAFGAVEHGVEAIIVTFTYCANATRIMFDAAGRGGGEGRRCGGARL